MAYTNQDFVLGLYRDLLYRTPSAEELNYYSARLDNTYFTRPQVANMFFSAPEYKGQIESVARLYWASYDRAPDYEGLLFWNSILRNGAGLSDIATIFSYSPEFAARYGANTSNEDFVGVLYQNALGRSPDEAGAKYWSNVLGAGASRGQVLNAFAQSQELSGKLALKTKAVAAYATLSQRSPTSTELASLPSGIEDLLLKAAATAGSLLSWGGDGFQESATNDGSLAASLSIKLSGDTFKGLAGAKLGTVANTPKGLTAALVKVSDTEAKLSFTGKATTHDAASSIANLSVTFTSADFTSGKVPVGASRSDLKVDFTDMLLYINGSTLSSIIKPNLTLTVDLSADTLKLGSTNVIPLGGTMSSVVNVDFSAIPVPAATTSTTSSSTATAQLIVFKGGSEANSYLASPLGDNITGGGGNDILTLGAGIDTVVLPSAPGSGVVEIRDFKPGKGGDILKLSGFLVSTKTANLGVIDTNQAVPATPKAWANGDVLLTIGSSALTATDIAALFGTQLALPTTARKAVVLSADVTGNTQIWYLTNPSGADVATISAAEVVLVGNLVGVNNLELAGLAANNFL
ncbi:DUF4214 domain-containing protein [Dechloromonas sp. ZY10]|uniref:DUF4214 domain-containing protein n=1 Tax=Dechloromonas aquae TaxID=2664436 RepID=UPI0035295AA1